MDKITNESINLEKNNKKTYFHPELTEENIDLETVCTESSSLNDGGNVDVTGAGNIEIWP